VRAAGAEVAMKLYTYFRSSAAFRVRIALALKGIEAEPVFVDLAQGQQLDPAYAAQNPQRLVPLIVDGDFALNQSLAILEYLEERYPDPPLLPADARARGRVRALASMVCSDIHPLQNLRVRKYLAAQLGQDEQGVLAWNLHWIDEGLRALEAMLAAEQDRSQYCYGSTPTFADVCLVPQLYNARRFGCDLARYPTLVAIERACLALPAFARALPEAQPDAVS
jgi:maleylacetoacetate isomerase